MNKKKKIVIISTGIALLLALGFILYKIGIFDRKSDCAKIASKISKLFESGNIYSVNDNPSQEYPFVEKFEIFTGKTQSGGPAVVLMKYDSSLEADLKQEYIKDKYIFLHSKIDNSILKNSKNVNNYFKGEDDLVFTNGVYFIKIDSTYKQEYSQLKESIMNIINKYSIKNSKDVSIDDITDFYTSQKKKLEDEIEELYNSTVKSLKTSLQDIVEKMEKCRGNECETYLKDALKYEKYTELKDSVSLVQEKYNDVIKQKNDLIKQINSEISKIEKSLNETDYANIKNRINNINDSFYDSYINDWKKRLDNIEEKVYKKSCKTYKYKDLLRNPESYEGNKTYWFGVVSQKVSSTQYRVGVNCTKYRYISGYSCSDTIYVYYYGDKKIIEDDVVKMWGTMDGTVTYTAVLGNSITIPAFEAKYVEL